MDIQTDGANMHWCSSALHLPLGWASIQQASGPRGVAVTSCSKHALCFVFRGGVVGAQGILNHKNAEYLSPFPLPPPHLNQRCSWNEIQLGFQTFSYLIQFTSRLIAKLKTDFYPFSPGWGNRDDQVLFELGLECFCFFLLTKNKQTKESNY